MAIVVDGGKIPEFRDTAHTTNIKIQRWRSQKNFTQQNFVLVYVPLFIAPSQQL